MSNKQRFETNKRAIDAALAAGTYRRDIAVRFGITDEYLIRNYILEQHGPDHPSMSRATAVKATPVILDSLTYATPTATLTALTCRNLLNHMTPRQLAEACQYDAKDFCAWVIQNRVVKTWLLPSRKRVTIEEAQALQEHILNELN
jgi:hypothetical protein